MAGIARPGTEVTGQVICRGGEERVYRLLMTTMDLTWEVKGALDWEGSKEALVVRGIKAKSFWSCVFATVVMMQPPRLGGRILV